MLNSDGLKSARESCCTSLLSYFLPCSYTVYSLKNYYRGLISVCKTGTYVIAAIFQIVTGHSYVIAATFQIITGQTYVIAATFRIITGQTDVIAATFESLQGTPT